MTGDQVYRDSYNTLMFLSENYAKQGDTEKAKIHKERADYVMSEHIKVAISSIFPKEGVTGGI